jgi:hypothetical protein
MSTTGRVGQSAFCAWAGKIIAIQMQQAAFLSPCARERVEPVLGAWSVMCDPFGSWAVEASSRLKEKKNQWVESCEMSAVM